ncbi:MULTISPECIES: hypothetical protein [unclassified Bradyrhizobium]|uniref:hypothetical protein n=1 Tax=unclassified Bradyrhizobium TaxID=2631580 RepID=UPI0032E018E1
MRNPGPSGRGFRFEGNRQNPGKIAPDVNLQLAGLGGEHDLLHQGTQNLARLKPGCLGIILQRRVESADLFTVERRHLGMEKWRRSLGISQLPLKLSLPMFELDHLGVDLVRCSALEN